MNFFDLIKDEESWVSELLIFFVEGSVVDRIVFEEMDLQFWVHYFKHLKTGFTVLGTLL